jgi:TatD DNase family protein
MSGFTDTHCHLDAAEFGDTQTEIVMDAAAVGVRTLVVPSVALGNFAQVRDLCQRHSGCAPAYGIHPLYVAQSHPEDLLQLRQYLIAHHPVAVGEIGLDFFVEDFDQIRQEYFFVEQLKLAQEFDLPVLLHGRRAQDTVLKHLRRFKVRGGIAHAFNGSRQQADEFIKLGFKLGFGGAMTHSRALRIRELAATLPMESIVLETDAPDIPPDFLARGKPNEPQYLPRIAQTLATLRDLSLDDVASATTRNALSVLPSLEKYQAHV